MSTPAVFRSYRSKQLVSLLRQGAVGVLPTDTIYGLVARAEDSVAVARLYALRKRTPAKPCIVLIATLADLSLFSIKPTKRVRDILARVWPGSVSVILPCIQKKFTYLHRGTKTLAIRLPKSASLRALIAASGPLIAPSANPEGLSPALTIAAARNYFGTDVDFYVDGGKKVSAPSSLIGLVGGDIIIHRAGAVRI